MKERLRHNDIAVLNAGIIGSSPLLEDILFAGKIRDYRPTLVLLFLDATDIGDDIQYSRELKEDGGSVHFELKNRELNSVRHYYGAVFELARPYVEPAMDYLVSAATGRPRRKYDYYDFQLNLNGTVETNRFFIYRYPLAVTRPYFLKTLEHINHLAAAVQASGARFILVVAPRFHHWNPRECPKNWERKEYSTDEPFQYEYFRFFDEIRGSLGYPVLNLLPVFRETKEFPLVFEDDPHWNVRGHAFVANVLAGFLTQNHLAN